MGVFNIDVGRQERICSIAVINAFVLLVLVAPAAATPNMIRLGYPNCASCHMSPQGAGLLTPYGTGIDLAQSLRPEESPDPERPGDDRFGRMLRYEARASLGIEREPDAPAEYGFSIGIRSAIGLANHRLVYAPTLSSPTLAFERRSGAVTLRMSRLYWMYQPTDGLQFVVGRDDLPSGGVGLQGFTRSVTNPSVSSTPTQAKVFWWNDRWQTSAYVYGPDGNESNPDFEAYGVGGLLARNLTDRAVVGVTTRASRADAFDRANAGVFVRLGLTHNFGVLLEHDVTRRTVPAGSRFTHIAGHSEVFFVPFDWLQTAVAGEHLTTQGGADRFRLTSEAQVRLTGNLRLGVSMQDVFATTNTRTFAFDVLLKTQ
jgi:hypothetical protein